MSLTKQQAVEMFRSDDLIGSAWRRTRSAASCIRGTVTYIIDRNINYTNFCTEYCTFCAFYRPLKGPAAKEGYILNFDTSTRKSARPSNSEHRRAMQGGLHPDLKIDWHERMLSGIKQRFPKIHLHCYSASEILAIAEYSNLSVRDTIARLRDSGLDSIPGGGAEILDDEVRYKIARLKCLTADWLLVASHRAPTRHAHHRDHDVWRRRVHRAPGQPLAMSLRFAAGDGRVSRASAGGVSQTHGNTRRKRRDAVSCCKS